MADKGKKGKPGATAAAAAAAAAAAPGAAPPPGDEVGRRKGWCRRYKLEVKNSNREFWLNGYAEVKLIILGCLIGSLMMFKGTTVHPHVTLIITMELSILIFFIIIYTFAIQRYTLFILWPISILIGVAALVALIDVCLQMTHFKGKKVKAGVRILPRKDKKGKKPKEGEKPEEAGKGRAAVPPPAKGGKGGGKK
ncbi:CKLF-like MARVEL transmembrane domain-containing protein 2 isoform X2 [Globicephala melas]|uniref:CKLF-like MARVEL transmembrane domain-containing protein 2 isoform X2 n=1 Tax=Globicephala melas TaxID=9731 RepID=UPI00293D6B29|nr:CKLF-like MARVEL transmembrane domain-containing protein 2 isoform X2 [Globicephala melas]